MLRAISLGQVVPSGRLATKRKIFSSIVSVIEITCNLQRPKSYLASTTLNDHGKRNVDLCGELKPNEKFSFVPNLSRPT
jgi:hypothetical protein